VYGDSYNSRISSWRISRSWHRDSGRATRFSLGIGRGAVGSRFSDAPRPRLTDLSSLLAATGRARVPVAPRRGPWRRLPGYAQGARTGLLHQFGVLISSYVGGAPRTPTWRSLSRSRISWRPAHPLSDIRSPGRAGLQGPLLEPAAAVRGAVLPVADSQARPVVAGAPPTRTRRSPARPACASRPRTSGPTAARWHTSRREPGWRSRDRTARSPLMRVAATEWRSSAPGSASHLGAHSSTTYPACRRSNACPGARSRVPEPIENRYDAVRVNRKEGNVVLVTV
jgi:hypothetical protein